MVEDILKSKAILAVPDQSSDVLLSELAKLRPKIPSIEVLQTTKLGVVLKKLTKHSDPRVSRSASSLVNSWKTDIRERRTKKSLEVQNDGKTDRFRKDARKLILESFKSKGLNLDQDLLTNLVDEIERELFAMFNRKTSEAYRRTVRKIVFSLRHRSDLRQQVLEGKTSVKTLIMANMQK